MNTIKKIVFGSMITTITLASCQNNSKKQGGEIEEHKAIAEKAIAIHDEIMPQISQFDKTAVKIDSILTNLEAYKIANPTLDTTNTRTELTTLKTSIESATDVMMDWMYQYSLAEDSTDVTYHEQLLKRVTEMKKQFENVGNEIETKLKNFN